jgi:hypothetical protein
MLEQNLTAFFELVMSFEGKLEEKFAYADLYEKDRLKSLYRLLKDNLDEFDRAQEARALLLLQAINAPVPAKP